MFSESLSPCAHHPVSGDRSGSAACLNLRAGNDTLIAIWKAPLPFPSLSGSLVQDPGGQAPIRHIPAEYLDNITTQHRRRGSRDDTEFGLGGRGNGRHVTRTSRGEELSVSHPETRNSNHVNVGRRGSAPGTPSRNQVCIFVERERERERVMLKYYQIIFTPQLFIRFANLSL